MKHLNIVYLIQLRSDCLFRYEELLSRDDVDVILLCYDKPVANAIYFPNSIWGEGRNKLLKEALKKKKVYLYYIFLDGDVRFTKGDYQAFEENLLRYAPAVAYPVFHVSKHHKLGFYLTRRLSWFTKMQVGTFGDGQFQAIHRDVVKDRLMVPFCQSSGSTWGDDEITRVNSFFYYDYILQFNHIVVDNLEHMKYVGQGDQEMRMAAVKLWQKENLRKSFPSAMLGKSIMLPFGLAFFNKLIFGKGNLLYKMSRLYYDLLVIFRTVFYKPKKSYCLSAAAINERVVEGSRLWRQHQSNNDERSG